MIKKNKKIYTVALIGCGRIGFWYDQGKKLAKPLSHFSAFYHSKNFNLIAVAETNNQTRKHIKDSFSVKVYSDYRELLKRERPEVVVIASPDETHRQALLTALEYKPLLVFCEKPLAGNLAEVTDIVKRYQRQGVPLLVNFTRRFLKEYSDIKRMINRGQFGKLQNVTVCCSRGLVHNFIHYLDLCLWYFGQPKKIIYESERPGLMANDPTINLTMLYPNGLEIRLFSMDSSNLLVHELDIMGDKARIKIEAEINLSEYGVGRRLDLYKEFKGFVLKKTAIIDKAKVAGNAVEHIYRHLTKREPLASPASQSVEIFKLIKRIKQ
jgi:predicted dehydrogenase